ncbi:MAG TPA: hypothetical protein VJP08_03225 [Actinomycetota bacterium]|nr:hypothetical protein [Actinomycetota bacterium]
MADESARQALERELYWLSGEEAEPSTKAEHARMAADRLLQRLRKDAVQAAPWGDPGLASGGGLRRRFKILLHRTLRPITRRYDRLAAELAAVQVALADCVLQLEAELRRLREEQGRVPAPAGRDEA